MRFAAKFEYFKGYILGCQIIKEMNEDFPNFNLGLDEYFKPKRQKTEETRFAQLNEDELDDLVEGAQAKSTKYATNYAVSVFKGNFLVKILW